MFALGVSTYLAAEVDSDADSDQITVLAADQQDLAVQGIQKSRGLSMSISDLFDSGPAQHQNSSFQLDRALRIAIMGYSTYPL